MKILNFGSLNLDYTYQVDHFVRPGETEASFSRTLACGGKGLNQSVALAKSGAEVYHAGAVGVQDGAILLDTLNRSGVNTQFVSQLDNTPSGSAFIQVTPGGENCIVLDGGANQAVSRTQIDDVLSHFVNGDWLVLQNEISELPYLMEKAHDIGMKIVLNPSPMNATVQKMPLGYVDYFLLNEEEAAVLASNAQSADVLEELSSRFPNAVIIVTLGAKGSVALKDGIRYNQEAYPVKAIDTVGAGDTFTGFLIGSLAEGVDLRDAMRLASKASSISVTRKGASTSIPELKEVIAALS
ncbi:MAG: ribokinase [Solobacterium sp.]|nr:ribokinase [Solobacterium sp.]